MCGIDKWNHYYYTYNFIVSSWSEHVIDIKDIITSFTFFTKLLLAEPHMQI